jgi:hypothetical protein
MDAGRGADGARQGKGSVASIGYGKVSREGRGLFSCMPPRLVSLHFISFRYPPIAYDLP